MTNDNGEGFAITEASKIYVARLLTIRMALKLEAKGYRRSRGRSARVLANEVMGTKFRTAKDAYAAFDAYLVDNYGAVSRPLNKEKDQ